jgi:hypothetical protein
MSNYVTVAASAPRLPGNARGPFKPRRIVPAPPSVAYQLSERTSESQPPLRTVYTLITP